MQHDHYAYDQDWDDDIGEPAVIQSVTYARLYNLGNDENERIEVTVAVEDNDATAAYITAVATVESEHQRLTDVRKRPATPVPATDKQRNYIAALQNKLGWHSEQMAQYAKEQRIDLVSMSIVEANKLIDTMKRLAAEDLPF